MLKPILYDFKRGILRISTLAILALFLLGGVGLAYLMRYHLAGSPITSVNRFMVIVLDPENKSLYLEGYVFDDNLNKVGGDFSYKLSCGGVTIISRSTHLDGYLRRFEKLPDDAHISPSNECAITLQFTSTLHYSYTYSLLRSADVNGRRVLYDVEGYTRIELISISANNKTVGEASAKLFRRGSELIVFGVIYSPVYPDAEYELYLGNTSAIYSAPQHLTDLESLGLSKVARVRQGFFNISVNNYSNASYLDIALVSSTKGDTVVGVYPHIPILKISVGFDPRVATMLMVMMSSIAIFIEFFPIVGLYLAYIYIAKPRSQGALEFVLARPITRLDLFLTRFLAGVAVIAISTTMFFLSVGIAVKSMFEVALDPRSLALAFLGVLMSLIAFYSLCYFVSTISSGGKYLILSIALYLVFTLIWQIAVSILFYTIYKGVQPEEISTKMSEFMYTTFYFNPIYLSNLYMLYLQKVYPDVQLADISIQVLEKVANPYLIALSTMMWIAAPLALGWLVFRRSNLSK